MSVNSYEEHLFISQFLKENDPQHLKWFTSGRDVGQNTWKWDGDRSPFTNIIDLWTMFPVMTIGHGSAGAWKHAAYK